MNGWIIAGLIVLGGVFVVAIGMIVGYVVFLKRRWY